VDEQGKRWRIPAVEIENAVLAALGSFLDDQSALSSILSLGRLPPAQTASVLKATTAVSRSLSQDHAGQLHSTLQSILSRIEIGDTTLTLTVALGRLREALELSSLGFDEPQTHAIVVPARITKRGVEQKLIIGGRCGDSVAIGSMQPAARDLRVGATVRAAAAARGNCGLSSRGSLRSLETAEGVSPSPR